MKYLVSVITFSLLALGCSEKSKISKETVKSALVGQSFYLINSPTDSVQVEFYDTCSRHYDWNKFIVDEWEVKEDSLGNVLLNYDNHDFVPKPVAGSEDFEFISEKTSQRLVKMPLQPFDLATLDGTWEDAHYAGAKPGMQLPKCQDREASVPAYVFKAGTATVRGFCETREEPYTVNAAFKIITIGDKCTSKEQLKIKELSSNQMVVDMQSESNGQLYQEFNKIYVKARG